jgi:hypothetical protein
VVVMVNRVVDMDNLLADMGSKVVVMVGKVEDIAVNKVEAMVVNQIQVMVDSKMVEVNKVVDTVDSKEVAMEEANRVVVIVSNMVVKVVEPTMHNPVADMDLNHHLQDNILVAEAIAHLKHQQAIIQPPLVVRDTVHRQQQLQVQDSLMGIKVMVNSLLHQHTAQVAMVHSKRQVNLATVLKVMVVKAELIINQEVPQVHIHKVEVPIIHLTEALPELVDMEVAPEQAVFMEVLE